MLSNKIIQTVVFVSLLCVCPVESSLRSFFKEHKKAALVTAGSIAILGGFFGYSYIKKRQEYRKFVQTDDETKEISRPSNFFKDCSLCCYNVYINMSLSFKKHTEIICKQCFDTIAETYEKDSAACPYCRGAMKLENNVIICNTSNEVQKRSSHPDTVNITRQQLIDAGIPEDQIDDNLGQNNQSNNVEVGDDILELFNQFVAISGVLYSGYLPREMQSLYTNINNQTRARLTQLGFNVIYDNVNQTFYLIQLGI